MDSLLGLNSQALLVKDSKEQKSKQISDSSGSSSSKKKEKNKIENPIRPYCKKGPHDKSHCF